MEHESKERSISRESNDEGGNLSLSESIGDKERSPGSSEGGTLKKPRKFKPGKFISKRFKLKKSEDEQKTADSEYSEPESSKKSSMVAKITEKLSSPKLQRFSFVKRFSGTKSYKVSPSFDGAESNLKKAVSESNMKKSNKTSEKSAGIVRERSLDELNMLSSQQETVTLESKKVEMKITMSDRKKSPSAIDMASQPRLLTNERNDIILPSPSAHVRLITARDQFFSALATDREKMDQQATKPITEDPTFATVVKDGLSVKALASEGSKEVEKYSVLTSSLKTIISAAKDFDDLSSSPREEEKLAAIDHSSRGEAFEEIIGIEQRKESFTTLSPISQDVLRIDEDIFEDDMKKTQSGDKDSLTTVHTQEAHKPYHVSLSSSSSEDLKSIPSKNQLNAAEIKFEVGTPVRPQRTSTAATTLVLGSEGASKYGDDSFHSVESEESFSTETRRRRIAYVPQLTIYTPEEQELLKSNIQANCAGSTDITPDTSIFPVFEDSAGVAMGSPLDKREHLYKILVIGELGTGKTSFIKRYVHQFFSQNYRATIGVDFALKVLNWDPSTIIRLQLWDIAGQERFGNMTRVYYKEAVGAFIVFDVTRSATFDAVLKWKQDLDSKVQLPDGKPIPCILLANKCDQPKQGLVTMPAKMDEYCTQNGFAGWFETSAKDNVNIEESAKTLVTKILNNDRQIHSDMVDGDRLVLAEDAANQKKKFCSC